jgi:hypothetical protein
MDDRALGEHPARPRWWVREVEKLSPEFDVVCLRGGVAGEAIAVGLKDSGLTLAVVERDVAYLVMRSRTG